jgi:group I intron endonuclease
MIGIYRIKNLINDKCYYGSSKNIPKRWKQHKNQLNLKTHCNIKLQRAWNKYGEENFVFEIVELCDIEFLLTTEQNYLNLKPEYNIGLNSYGGDNLSNNPNKEIILKSITKSIIKRMDLMSDEERKLKYSKPLDKNPNWKGGTSYNYCECGKQIKPDYKYCNKCRPRNDKNNPFYGKTHSLQTKELLSQKRVGKYSGCQNIPIIIDEIEYRSAGEASKILNIPMVTIRWRVKSNNLKFSNYKYKINYPSFKLTRWQ